jgi:hypothetical protein
MKITRTKNFSKLILIGILISFNSISAQTKSAGERVGETIEVKDKEIDWEAFDATSSILKSEIKFNDLQGLWNAFEGVYRFDQHVNAMKLTQPYIIEVNEETYRRNSKSTFKKFTIKENVITLIDNSKVEIGIINKITPTELVISWKNNSNYTRYYYKK